MLFEASIECLKILKYHIFWKKKHYFSLLFVASANMKIKKH